MRILVVAAIVAGATIVGTEAEAAGRFWYIAPNGVDSSTRGSAGAPFATFDYAFSKMAPGDWLIVKDGTYNQSIAPPIRLNGTASAPTIIVAEREGRARINGGGTRIPIHLQGNDWIVFHGLVAYNSKASVIAVWHRHDDKNRDGRMQESAGEMDRATNNMFLRVSAYNSACVGCNNHIWELWNADHTTVQDCIGAGRARTVFVAQRTNGTIVRRCWFRSDANANYTGGTSKPGDTTALTIYNSQNAIVENNIDADPMPGGAHVKTGFHDWNNVYGGASSQINVNNRYYGNVVGNITGNPFGVSATQCKLSRDHLFRDNVAVNTPVRTGAWARGFAMRAGRDVVLDHNTFAVSPALSSSYPNGQGVWMSASVRVGQDSLCENLASSTAGPWGYFADAAGQAPYQHAGFSFRIKELKNSVIQGHRVAIQLQTNDKTPPSITKQNNNSTTALQWNTTTYGDGAYLLGATNAPLGDDGRKVGARVVRQYVNGTLTTQPLWPFPMEDRVWTETGDPALWNGANAMFRRHQQSATWDGAVVNGVARTGGFWKTLSGVS